jgi:hypothetical protein
MNTQLVDTLAQIINALTPEEKALLQEKATFNQEQDGYQKIVEVREQILARRGGKPLDMDVSEMIYQMREERSQELMDACFPNLSQQESKVKE